LTTADLTHREIVIVEHAERPLAVVKELQTQGPQPAIPLTVTDHARFGHSAPKSTATFRPLDGQTPYAARQRHSDQATSLALTHNVTQNPERVANGGAALRPYCSARYSRALNLRSEICRLVGPVACLARFGGLGPDAVLDVNELLGASLALGADENVARVAERAAHSQAVADDAGDCSWRHRNIFAPHA
jgi:hypothetical protein